MQRQRVRLQERKRMENTWILQPGCENQGETEKYTAAALISVITFYPLTYDYAVCPCYKQRKWLYLQKASLSYDIMFFF